MRSGRTECAVAGRFDVARIHNAGHPAQFPDRRPLAWVPGLSNWARNSQTKQAGSPPKASTTRSSETEDYPQKKNRRPALGKAQTKKLPRVGSMRNASNAKGSAESESRRAAVWSAAEQQGTPAALVWPPWAPWYCPKCTCEKTCKKANKISHDSLI